MKDAELNADITQPTRPLRTVQALNLCPIESCPAVLTRSRLAIVVVVGAVMAIAALVYVQKFSPLSVGLAQPRTNVEIRVFGIGTVEAQVLTKVGFQVSGKVAKLLADQGEIVAEGAVLASLEDSSQRARVAKAQVGKMQAEAALAKANALLGRAEANLQQKSAVNQRRQSLVDRGSVSREAADDAQTNEMLARADLEVAKAELLVAAATSSDVAATLAIEQVLLNQHQLVAPFRARVLSRLKEAGSVAGIGEALFSLIDPNSIWVRAYVDEAQAGGLRVGQKALVRLRSDMATSVEAQIVRIDQESDRVTEERRVYVRCVACVPEHQSRFLGEQAEVEIIRRVVPEGIFIPLITVDGYNGTSGTIWTLEDGKLNRRTVSLADRTLDGHVLVTGGLPDGSQAVLGPAESGFAIGRSASPRAPDAAPKGTVR